LERGVPGFVQIMEYKTSRIDEVIVLAEKMRAERGAALLATRAIMAADRERPGCYMTIVEFDSYEQAMTNSNDPATTEFAKQMSALVDGPVTFYNLDVSLVVEQPSPSSNTDKYRRAIAGFSAVVDAVPAEMWSASSPCEGWTARDVVGHVIGGTQMISAVATGLAPDFSDPAAAAGDDPATAFAKARDLALGALTEENLAKLVHGPIGEIPLDQHVGMFSTPDVLIHTWDLAKAAGIEVQLDAGLVRETYDALLPIDEMIRMPNVFGPKVEPPAGADPQTILMCFVGRQP
jgi:uncharacterized protein (TIGR03086 family)